MDAPTANQDHPVDETSYVFESFPEYHNFPDQWDLSEIETPTRAHSAANAARGNLRTQDAPEKTAPERPIPVGDEFSVFSSAQEFRLDPFPKTRTFPVYWDLSR